MKVNNIYVDMFYVLDAEYEEHPTDELAIVLGGMNPFHLLIGNLPSLTIMIILKNFLSKNSGV